MKNHSKEFRDILDSSNIQEKLRNIKDDTGKNLCSVLKISNEDIEELRKIINKNKMNALKNGINSGIPTGEIKFKGNIIPIDLIFDRVNWLKKAYENALTSANKDKELELANDKLISTIFLLLDEENKKNQEQKEAKDKALERKRYKDAEHSLKHKLSEQKGSSIELTDKYEIIVRLNTIGVGDRITFKDGYSVVIVGKKSGTTDGKNVKVRFEGTPSLSAEGHRRAEGEWWNLDNLLKISGTTIDDIRQLNIPPQLGKKPNKPNKHVKPDEPVNPVKPDEPVNPVKPDEPVNPVKPDEPIVFPPKGNENPDEEVAFKETAVLSDVSESYEDMISREVENEINEEWHNTARYNVFKRGKLWFGRGLIRKNRIKKMKELYERTPFTNNGTINKEMVQQATRHDLEEVLQGEGVNRSAFGEIKRENMIAAEEVSGDSLYETTRGKEFREMAQDYVSGKISQVEFQNKFNEFVHDKLGLPKEQQFVATNILEKLDAIKNDNELLKSITSDLEKYLTDHNNSHFDDVHKKINDDFKKYRKDPRFRAELLKILGNTEGLDEKDLDKKIEKFIRHEQALARASMTNLQIKLDLLTNGKGAYQINNKDRENWLFKLGHKLDKMPRWGQVATAVGISLSGAAIAAGLPAIGLGGFTVLGMKGAAFVGTATMSTLVGAKNFIKKWTHHTKEQNTYEKNLVRNYEEEIAQMKERENIRDEKDSDGKHTHSWLERQTARRQLRLYGKTTQSELQNENTGNTKELSDFIYTALERYDTLTPEEKNALNCTLLDSKARLETYWNIGHNFLKSKDKNQIERDFYNLENALNLAAKRTLKDSKATLKDVSLVEAYDEDGKAVDYNDLLNLYKKDYNSATKRFRGERAWLATRRGLGTAAVTFGTAWLTQYFTKTGMYARDAVQGTPDIPESHETLSRQEATDYYKLGQWERYETNDNAIFKAAQDNISNLKSGNGVSYGVKVNLISGTDGSQLAPGSPLLDPNTYKTELEETIRALRNSNISNKWEIINRLRDSTPTDGFTNGALYSMRDLNAIEKIATGAGNFNGSMEFVQDVAHGIDGQIPNNMWDRLTRATIEVTKTTAGKMGTAAVEAGKQHYIVPVFWFDNTFKRRNGGTPKDRGNDSQPDNPPSTGENGGNDNGGDIVPPIIVGGKGKDKGDDEGKDKGNEKGDKKEPDKILPPVDPNDPAGPTDEKKPREKITGERKGIITRGHLINSDIDDLGEEYPGSGEMLPTHDSALLLFGRRKDNDLECFTEEDINELRNLSGNDDAQIRYLESKIIEDRNIINDTENNETMKKFNDSMETSKQWIRKFLPEIVGDIDSQLLNKFLSDKRIHVVSDREYIGVIGSNRRSSGLFRGESGDLYIRYSYIQAYEDERISGDNSYWTGMSRHQVLIHEMVHSMSTMNYLVSEEDGKLKYDRRRVGLQQFRYDRNGKYLGETGRSMNEASTESLCWEICRRGFNSIGLDLSPYREGKITYKAFIDVIDQLGETDHIKNEDFWKAMLIRKRAKDKDIELDTPLFELVGKVDGRQEENGKIKYSRPNYYNLISNSMDFAHVLFNEKNVDGFETRWIIDFIIKKDINILKDYIQSQNKKLSDVFDKDLLTKDSRDFKQEILDAYNGR